MERIARVRAEAQKNHCFNILHNNALAYNVTILQQFLLKKGVPVHSHPEYSPDLNPPSYFAFSKLKMEVNSDQYKNILKIQKSVMEKLKAILIHEWEKAIKRLKDCAKG